eukprot:COSAG05_NODE_19296_length_295_cov_0.387755_2_plen_48_part_01
MIDYKAPQVCIKDVSPGLAAERRHRSTEKKAVLVYISFEMPDAYSFGD